MSLAEAEELAKYREVSKFLSQMRSFAGNAEIPPMELSNATKKVMDDISERLDKVFKEFGGTGAFVKLSTRSPKDAVLSSQKIKQIIEEELGESEQDEYKGLDWSTRALIAFTRACSKTMKVTSGREAIELLFNSDRTYQDILRMKLMLGDKFEMKLIARKWVDIDPELEFRTFVVDKKIVACTQYYPLCYVPKLSQNKEKITKLLFDYFDKVKDLIKIDTYTIDFVLSRDLNSVQIIELNNPPPTAGVALFNWDDANDRKIVTEGPYELRILDALPEKAMSEIQKPLALLMLRLEQVQKKSRGEIEDFNEEDFVCHVNSSCNECRKTPIMGYRFHCLQCKGCYDLCRSCFEEEFDSHDKSHNFEVFKSPDLPAEPVERSKKRCLVM